MAKADNLRKSSIFSRDTVDDGWSSYLYIYGCPYSKPVDYDRI
jgi:hypothetical protein